jgi:hypothetical protein
MSVESDDRSGGWCTKVVEELGRGLEGGSAPGMLEDMSVLLINLPRGSRGGRLSVRGFM